MDIIYLHGLQIETVIGVYDWERQLKQTVILDLDMGFDVARGAATDRLEDTLNYKAVAKRVIAFVQHADYQLVESLAESVACMVRDEFGIPWLRLRVNKAGAVRGAQDVGVVIERGTPG